MGSKKVVCVNRFFYPDISATSQMVSDLAFHLAEKHHVHVVTSRLTYEREPERLPAKERTKQTIIHRVWTSRFGRRTLLGRAIDYVTFYVSASLRLLVLLKRGDVVVSMTDPPLLSLPVAVVAGLKGARLVNWLQDLFPEVAGQLDFKRFRKFLDGPLAWLRDRSLSAAACNVVLGDLMAATLEKKGIATDQIRVIPNWASSDRITPLPRELNPLRRAWGLNGKFVVGYSGNFGRAHEFASLLSAARDLSRRPEIVFLLIGGGRQRARLEAEAESQNLDNVMFQAYQPRELLSQSLSAADCHIVSLRPSLEGLIVPSKVYSAMAAGRPVIFLGALDGEIPRMMATGLSFGVCLAPDDAAGLVSVIEYMCDSPEPSAALGENGRELFERQFDQPIALAKWSELMTALGLGVRASAGVAEDSDLWRMDIQTCPSCASSSAHRSRSRSRAERVRRDLTSDRLYRCHSCGWRGWLMPLDAGGSQGPVDAPPAPDFVRLDRDTTRKPVRVASASLEDLE
jgi:glycosyltransferase involved in cell wall biosynthesis